MRLTHSIIIPTHNRPEQLRRCVISAMEAAGETGEVIVVDDASETPAEHSLSDLHFDRLHCVRHPVPMAGGGSPARNTGVSHSKGDVLFFLDDDDEVLSDYCSSILDDRVQDQADFGFSARAFVCGNPDQSTTKIETRDLTTGVIPEDADFRQKTFPFSAGFWLKRAAYETVGPMESKLRTNSDTEYTCSLYSSDLRGWYSAKPGMRIYDQSVGPTSEAVSVTKRTTPADRADAFAAIATKHADFLASNQSAGRFIYSRLAKHAARCGRQVEALGALKKIKPWSASAKAHLLTFPLMLNASKGDG